MLGSQLLSGDYVQKHSSSRENEVSWRIKHQLKAGGIIREGDKESEPTAMTGDGYQGRKTLSEKTDTGSCCLNERCSSLGS